MGCVVGVDLGGTAMRAAKVSAEGTAEGFFRARHGGFPRPRDAVEKIVRAVERVAGGETVDAVGVGIAAWVERSSGYIARAPNLGWIDVPLGELLHRKLGVRVVVHNDLKAIAWGEYRFGAGRHARVLLAVYVGTGVGSAVVSDGVLQLGARGFFGEIGHVRVGPDNGPQCGCGHSGCLEAYVGGSALARRAEESIAHGKLQRLASHSTALTVEDLERAACAGDAEAQRLLEQGGELLGRVLGSTITFLNPDVLLLGGGVYTSSEHIKDSVRLGIDLTAHPDFRRSVRIVDSALGDRAGVSGAADLARAASAPWHDENTRPR